MPVIDSGIGRLKGSLIWARDEFVEKVLLPVLFSRNKGFYVLSEDWRNLIILDACRYDEFSRCITEHKIEGHLESRISRGSDTRNFLIENFSSTKRDDVIYVTANPHVNRFLGSNFHSIVPVWRDGWDAQSKTVLPKTVVSYALESMRKNPDKRFIIHFMQPHHPYLGYLRKTTGHPLMKNPPANIYTPPWNNWYAFMVTHSVGDLKALYRRNLNLVLDEVERLLRFLGGKTVITADHGEAFGESVHPLIPLKIYEHPPHVMIPTLVRVPWFVAQVGEATIPAQMGGTAQSELQKGDEELIAERLKLLGYA